MRTSRLLGVMLACVLIQPALTIASAQKKKDAHTQPPIKHLVVIFGENISFDHYFGTYPNAMNPAGEPALTADPATPSVNGLSGGLLTANPNLLNPANGTNAANPFRLGRNQAWTADQGHSYMPEQQAVDKGLMDLFPLRVGTADNVKQNPSSAPFLSTKALTMGYYDGNTVTAYWNYAQHFAMSDNSYDTVFGPSTPGALNLISGQTNGAIAHPAQTSAEVDGSGGSLTVVGDPDPYLDTCSAASTVEMKGRNIGDLLNDEGITWGWFQGGFDLSKTNDNGSTGCARSSVSPVIDALSHTDSTVVDYVPHHQPFQYYASTRNPDHLRPTSPANVGFTDAANHQYDIQDFYDAVNAGNFPAVSFLKAPKFQNGHAANSDPLDEQAFVVHVINFLMQQPDWCNTAVVIAYDDSDGWYDHQMGPIVNMSTGAQDALTGTQACGDASHALPGPDGVAHALGRCGYGPRQPLLVVSPWARRNYVDHTVTDQTSILRFIEDNWLDGARIGDGSFDTLANSISSLFDFSGSDSPFQGNHCDTNCFLFLDEQTGLVARGPKK